MEKSCPTKLNNLTTTGLGGLGGQFFRPKRPGARKGCRLGTKRTHIPGQGAIPFQNHLQCVVRGGASTDTTLWHCAITQRAAALSRDLMCPQPCPDPFWCRPVLVSKSRKQPCLQASTASGLVGSRAFPSAMVCNDRKSCPKLLEALPDSRNSSHCGSAANFVLQALAATSRTRAALETSRLPCLCKMVKQAPSPAKLGERLGGHP